MTPIEKLFRNGEKAPYGVRPGELNTISSGTGNKPFREKYFDEAFPPWHVQESFDKDHYLINADEWYGPFCKGDADGLCHMHTRVRNALWEAVKYDYELFTRLRDAR